MKFTKKQFGVMNAAAVGRRSIAVFSVAFSMTADFRARERQTFEIRAEAFNLENRIILGLPVATLSSSTFSRINAEPAGNGAVAAPDYGGRVMQFPVKYIF